MLLRNRTGGWLGMVFILLQITCTVKQPALQQRDVTITLPAGLRRSTLEFSSLAWYGSSLVLVPQYPDRFHDQLYTLSSGQLDGALQRQQAIQADSLQLVNLPAVKQAIGSTYEGFEATVVVGNRIFFTIETGAANADCYLVGGRLQSHQVLLDPSRILALPKLKRLSNAGFESLAWWASKRKLLAFFEYNKADAQPRALVIDTSLTQLPATEPLDPLMFRITDVAATGAHRFIGLNVHYNGKKEYGEYIGQDSVVNDPALRGKSLRQTCYTRIIRLEDKNGRIRWKKAREITFDCENWEGIAVYKNGVFAITDEHPGSLLKWFSLGG